MQTVIDKEEHDQGKPQERTVKRKKTIDSPGQQKLMR